MLLFQCSLVSCVSNLNALSYFQTLVSSPFPLVPNAMNGFTHFENFFYDEKDVKRLSFRIFVSTQSIFLIILCEAFLSSVAPPKIFTFRTHG